MLEVKEDCSAPNWWAVHIFKILSESKAVENLNITLMVTGGEEMPKETNTSPFNGDS